MAVMYSRMAPRLCSGVEAGLEQEFGDVEVGFVRVGGVLQEGLGLLEGLVGFALLLLFLVAPAESIDGGFTGFEVEAQGRRFGDHGGDVFGGVVAEQFGDGGLFDRGEFVEGAAAPGVDLEILGDIVEGIGGIEGNKRLGIGIVQARLGLAWTRFGRGWTRFRLTWTHLGLTWAQFGLTWTHLNLGEFFGKWLVWKGRLLELRIGECGLRILEDLRRRAGSDLSELLDEHVEEGDGVAKGGAGFEELVGVVVHEGGLLAFESGEVVFGEG